MALGVLAEAGSRLAAENARAKASAVEEEARRGRAVDEREVRRVRRVERVAAAARARRTREWARFASDGERLRDYLRGLPVQEVARHWGQAVLDADGDPAAMAVLAAAEGDLRRRWPGLIDVYDQLRAEGVARREAMGEAARSVWWGDRRARRHGGRPPTAGALPRLGDELEREVVALAGGLDPVARARLLANLEDAGWSAESLAHVEDLLDRAGRQHRDASVAAGTPDDPATPLDERMAGQAVAGVATGRADGDAAAAAAVGTAAGGRTAAEVAGESFPVPARRALTAHPASTPASRLAPRRELRRTR